MNTDSKRTEIASIRIKLLLHLDPHRRNGEGTKEPTPIKYDPDLTLPEATSTETESSEAEAANPERPPPEVVQPSYSQLSRVATGELGSSVVYIFARDPEGSSAVRKNITARDSTLGYSVNSISEWEEEKLVETIVIFLDENLGDYLGEELQVELVMAMHGSLELILAVVAGLTLTGNMLDASTSLVANASTIAEVIEKLSREWFWREGLVAPGLSAVPLTQRKRLTHAHSATKTTASRTQTAISKHSETVLTAPPAQDSRNSTVTLVVLSAFIAAATTAIVSYSLFSEDITNLNADMQAFEGKLGRMEGVRTEVREFRRELDRVSRIQTDVRKLERELSYMRGNAER